MKAYIHTYKEVVLLDVVLRANGSCRRGDPVIYHKRDVINKMACYYPFGVNTCSQLYEMTSDTSIAPGSKLFVASECKTGRDTFRNSGYKITREKDKANAIVVPDVKSNMLFSLNCNIAAMDEEKEEFYIIRIHKSGFNSPNVDQNDVDTVSVYLESAMGLKVDNCKMTKFEVWFIPKCEELVNIMTENTLSVPYIQESLVPINASTQFTAETLIFWENIDDPNLLMRTICTSDWNKYPVTLLAFLCNTQKKLGTNNWYAVANGDFRRILQVVGYQAYYDFFYQDRGKSLTPADYTMLQQYLYAKMGLGPEGGVVDPKMLDSLGSGFLPYLQRKIALKPLEIPSKMDIDNVKKLATG